MQLTAQEIQQLQGTRLNTEKAPWETYNESFQDNLDSKLEEEIKQYSERRYESTSSQTKEELARQKEINSEIAKEYQWVTPDEYADEGPRIGKILHSSELINKLRKECKLRCWYRQHPQPRKITLMVQKFGSDPEVGCWVQDGFCPEFTIMNFDEHDVPLAEKYRGWRTPLLQLILKGFITEDTVNKVFGKATGPASERYNSLLYEFRNRRISVV